MTSFPPVPALPPGTVLLHVGVHKTGTTAIQAALADARPDLRERGVNYPGAKAAQHRAALAVLQRPWGWNTRGGSVVDRSHFDELASQTRKHAGRVVISSEFFCEVNEEDAVEVVRALGADRVHVVVTLRNLGRLLPSSWQQYLKYGLTTPYRKWLRGILEEPGRSPTTPTFWRRHDHAAVLARWSAAAGPRNVTAIVLEDVPRDAMFRTFAQMLDVPEDVLVSRMDLTSNRSMTAAEAEFLVRLNKQVKDQLQWDDYVKFIRRGVALAIVEGREPEPDEPRLMTPNWALNAAAAEGRRFVTAIREMDVRVVGDLDLLAVRVESAPVEPGEEPARTRPVELPVDAAVQAVATVVRLARKKQPVKRPSTGELFGELWRRIKARTRSVLRRRS